MGLRTFFRKLTGLTEPLKAVLTTPLTLSKETANIAHPFTGGLKVYSAPTFK